MLEEREADDPGSAVSVADPDHALVAAARRDPLAFEALYRKYVTRIYSFALYATRDPHLAEDVTEQVFLRALAALPRFRTGGADGTGTFRAWLFRIARTTIANEERRIRRRPVAPLELAHDVAAPDDPAAAVEARDEAARAWAAIERLPEDRRRALVLRIVEELSPREIGEILGRSEGAVRVLVHRALRSVADELAPGRPAPRTRWWRR